MKLWFKCFNADINCINFTFKILFILVKIALLLDNIRKYWNGKRYSNLLLYIKLTNTVFRGTVATCIHYSSTYLKCQEFLVVSYKLYLSSVRTNPQTHQIVYVSFFVSVHRLKGIDFAVLSQRARDCCFQHWRFQTLSEFSLNIPEYTVQELNSD